MIVYTVNLDYRCNERCTFCAADLGGHVPRSVRTPSLSLEQVRVWFANCPPRTSDRVIISGGEPTLHRELLGIIELAAGYTPNVALFTNGVRLADPGFARAVAAAGVGSFEISLFGPDSPSHEAITRRRGSFEATMTALRHLTSLSGECSLLLAVRLLVARPTVALNSAIVKVVVDSGIRPHWFSINKAILSNDADKADAPISWADAREHVNATVRYIRSRGQTADAPTVPLCVLDPDNRNWLAQLTAFTEGGNEPLTHRYLDPLLDPAALARPRLNIRPSLPDVCLDCAVATRCVRVQSDYLRKFGEAGLRPLSSGAL